MKKPVSANLIDIFMVTWTVLTTASYTIILGIPAICVALLTKTGKAPYYLGKLWSWLIMKTNGVRLQVIGVEKIITDNSYIFIANHASNLDPPAMLMALPQTVRFIGKRSLARIPVFGLAAKLSRMIFIDRSDTAKAIDVLNKAVQDLKDGISAFIFAEGTRSDDGRLMGFKKGGIMLALKAKLPIIPITIVDSYKLLPKNKLRIQSGIMKIIVGDPIDTTGYNESDKDMLVQKVRDIIAQNLQRYSDTYKSQRV